MYDDSVAVLDPTEAKSQKLPPAPPTSTYRQPDAHVGQLVMWRADPRELVNTCPAFVVKVGADALSLLVLVDGNPTLFPRDGVRHLNDPRWTEQSGESGVWFHTDGQIEHEDAFQQLANTIDNVNRVLQELTERAMAQEQRLATLESVVSK